jgi:hypothetical protein
MKSITSLLAIGLLISCGGGGNQNTDNADVEMAKGMATGVTGGAVDAMVSAAAATKKYDVKSGIVTYDCLMSMSGMNIRTKKVLYFDDYGNQECEETYKVDPSGKESLSDRNFVKDGFRYSCSVEYGGGAKTKAMGTGVAARFNVDEASTMKDNKFAKLGDENVCGKTCNGFSMETGSGKISMHGWSGIALKTVLDNAAAGMKSESKAVKFEENAAVPADVFSVPAGVKMTEM